jgi:Glucose-6-phosphate 1-dehydrogenase
LAGCYYIAGDFNQTAVFTTLKEKIATVQRERNIPGQNVVFNLAVTPTLFGTVTAQLGAAGLLQETPDGYRRVIIENLSVATLRPPAN